MSCILKLSLIALMILFQKILPVDGNSLNLIHCKINKLFKKPQMPKVCFWIMKMRHSCGYSLAIRNRKKYEHVTMILRLVSLDSRNAFGRIVVSRIKVLQEWWSQGTLINMELYKMLPVSGNFANVHIISEEINWGKIAFSFLSPSWWLKNA